MNDKNVNSSIGKKFDDYASWFTTETGIDCNRDSEYKNYLLLAAGTGTILVGLIALISTFVAGVCAGWLSRKLYVLYDQFKNAPDEHTDGCS